MSRYIDEHGGRFGVEPICRVLAVSASVWALVRVAASEQDAAVFLTAAFTGLREGELLARSSSGNNGRHSG